MALELEIGYPDEPLGKILVREGRVDLVPTSEATREELESYLNKNLLAMVTDFGFDPQSMTAGDVIKFLETRGGGSDWVRAVQLEPPATFADESARHAPTVPAKPKFSPVTPRPASRSGVPAAGEVATAGADGAALAKLLGQSKSYGVKVMADLVAGAVKRFKGFGPLLNHQELKSLAAAIAAVNSTAELLGRSRTRERADRAAVFTTLADRPPDVPFATFADSPPGVMATPEDAVAFFMSRRPELGIDPHRFGTLQRRQAFTLAASANLYLTERIQKIIGEAMRANRGTAEAQRAISRALSEAGVSPKNPQYSEMVFRTNAMDSFQQGMFEEGQKEKDAFPVWQYLGIEDGREGDDHRPKFGKYFPRTASFSEVRGERVFNCRCGMKWIDKHEWHDLTGRGERTEEKW